MKRNCFVYHFPSQFIDLFSPTFSFSAETKETKASTRSRSVPSRQLLKGKLEISKPMTVDQGQSHQSRSGKERSSKPKYKEYEMSHRTELEHVLQRLVLMSYFPSGFWSRILTRILADDSVVEIVRLVKSQIIF